MKHTYTIAGMTCEGCKASVTQALNSLDEVQDVKVDLSKGEAEITMSSHVETSVLQKALDDKYRITEKKTTSIFGTNETSELDTQKSKFQQLQPLFIIFGYILVAAVLLNYSNWDTTGFMLDFMGLFFIVFSFFKILDLRGFPSSFQMYDPLAKVFTPYAWSYPFIEIVLGLMFLMRYEVNIALIVTLVILGITTVGVLRTLLSKKTITCACLGTALKLPMTEATFIENAIMIIMAVYMIFKNGIL
ncbi:MAG: heavy metal transporter [Flavobacterium sp.]|nr:MAG: heavy metal transporter [Flavobacterium sp.]